jgi:hypothetical protein
MHRDVVRAVQGLRRRHRVPGVGVLDGAVQLRLSEVLRHPRRIRPGPVASHTGDGQRPAGGHDLAGTGVPGPLRGQRQARRAPGAGRPGRGVAAADVRPLGRQGVAQGPGWLRHPGADQPGEPGQPRGVPLPRRGRGGCPRAGGRVLRGATGSRDRPPMARRGAAGVRRHRGTVHLGAGDGRPADRPGTVDRAGAGRRPGSCWPTTPIRSPPGSPAIPAGSPPWRRPRAGSLGCRSRM